MFVIKGLTALKSNIITKEKLNYLCSAKEHIGDLK